MMEATLEKAELRPAGDGLPVPGPVTVGTPDRQSSQWHAPESTALPSIPVWGREAPQRIAVFRALQLGDMLCSVPALRALREAFPQARITLIGLDTAHAFVERFAHYIDELAIFPGAEGMPEQPPRAARLPAFFEWARRQRFDLAIQLHGSGASTNALVERLGARAVAGFKPAGQPRGAGFMTWPDRLPEPERYVELMRFLGLPVRSSALEFPLATADRHEAQALVDDLGLRPPRTVVFHPGARLPSRRWPVAYFAQVMRALSDAGWHLAVTGGADERPLVHSLIDAAGVPAHDLSGRTSLGGLAALLARCRLLVCNDTGVSHVAAAMRTPSVVVASGSDVRRWAPLDRVRHRVVWKDMPCRPCAHHECPIGHPCAVGLSPQPVLAQARRLLAGEPTHA
ncbi:glycosyltransferase family 9 protein [Pigmentiphaga soli]|uniref:Glycosyltransferase family 9 protein n=2 Tax=Pigmentiphaga soli TaxID=1007095 RepID=A0ABP8GGF2_9BURK